ncbi:hypothetical protein [Roseovarius ramblicola]|uniref:Phage integrase family protein n=1 Tax=Roseovarius ramblicola TaxID=2022336 RepID=A0ABV5I3W9_9RHOB
MDATAQKRVAREFYNGFQPRFSFSNAWTCAWEDLAEFPVSPVSVASNDRASLVEDDIWLLAEIWLPINWRSTADRTVDFTKAVPAGWGKADAESLKRRIKRLALLDGFLTLRISSQTSNPPTPATWANKTRSLIGAVRHSLEILRPDNKVSSCPDGPTLFAGLSPEKFRELQTACPSWNNVCISRLNGLLAGGFIDDWPAPDVERIKHQKRENSKADQPFTDTTFTEIVRAALWLCEIQHDVLQAYLDLRDIGRIPKGGKRRVATPTYRRECVRNWSSSALREGTPFPYKVSLSGPQRRTTKYSAWPLDTVRGLRDLVWCCQIANAVIILASTGMRVGELTALPASALGQVGGRIYINGSTFKDTDAIQGQARQWPLPRLACRAVEGQIALAHALGDGGALWVSFIGDKNSSGIPDLGHGLVNFGKRVGLHGGRSLHDLDGTLSPHRFRYTIARLIALSLTNASQVLFDVLGHDDVEVTLGYAHRDPELLEEINKVRREVKAIRVQEAFRDVEGNGGGAAALLRRIKSEMLARSGKDELDTDDIGEAGEILGEAELVKHGVLCTAQPLERGACSSSLGLRDFASCTSACVHHLEFAAKRQDRKLALEQILSQIGRAEDGSRVFLQGQVLANLHAFPGLIDEYASDPRLSTAFRDCDRRTWDALPSDLRQRLNSLLEYER